MLVPDDAELAGPVPDHLGPEVERVLRDGLI
jgi:hypothetical protein